jgi:2-amino-4-hydroxy-6-hydroxymethyldihydropteridine diphosphokinase
VRAYVAVGTNLGDRWAHLRVARRELRREPRLAVLRASRVYDTVALDPRQPRYLNAVLEIETGLEPQALLALLLGIEDVAFRRRDVRFGSRTLDLDLVLYEDLILSTPRLILPHPRLAVRRFVLGPLAELSPGRRVPGHPASVAELLGTAPVHDMRPVGLFPA